ncbi:MAG: hypothetical protein M3014_07540 [Chloroflexota bacterium]|nr:hypothetical protein [Chloroflexota bacterium]
MEWCGKVQRVVTGESYSFRGWPELVEHLLVLLADVPAHQGKDPLTFEVDEQLRS